MNKKKISTVLKGGYLKTGYASKLLNSPSISLYPDKWQELDDHAKVWEDRLYVLRTMQYDTCKPHPHLEEIRELRVKLSKIDSEMHKILIQANPKYDKHWYGEE